MKLVIDIPEERFKDIQRIAQVISYRRLPALEKVIANGTPLPKGHGRLIDIGKYEKEYFNVAIQYDDGNHVHSDYTNTITTIIEADKAESEDKA